MKLWTVALMGLSLVVVGCDGETKDDTTCTDTAGCEDTGDTADTEDTDTEPPPEMEVSAELTAAGVTLTITNGTDAAGYEFGIAQTTGVTAGWFGEDCVDGQPDTTYNYCHPASSTGVTLTHAVELPLTEGSTTLFNSDDVNTVTYILKATSTTDCWVWGADVSYYADQGCTDITPM